MPLFVLRSAVGGSTVPAEYCEQVVDDQTVLAMLLPNIRGQGLCAIILVHYMIQIHNNFMENYSRLSQQRYSLHSVCVCVFVL